MRKSVLVLGGTGTLGVPVVRSLVERGHFVRILTRSVERARRIFGEGVDALEGDATDLDRVAEALDGCHAAHVSLPTESELRAVEHLVTIAHAGRARDLQRISYVSGTSVCEENRWYDMIDVKMKAEERLGESGIPHTVFCPTWVMEVLGNFVRTERAVAILGRRPPGFHFFAAADLGRMVAASLEDDRAAGRRLFIHGPEVFTLPEAIERYHHAVHPEVPLRTLRVWQARLIAGVTRQRGLATAARLIGYFDRTTEHGDPAEANALLGAPSITLNEWIQTQREESQMANDRPDRNLSHLSRREAQAPLASALIRGFAEAMGEENARAVAEAVIRQDAIQSGRSLAETYSDNSLKTLLRIVREVWAADDTMQIANVELTAERLDFDVTACGYAEMYKRMGLLEQGCLLSCNRDFSFNEGFNPDIELRRTQTIMEGADHCDFRYRKRGRTHETD